MPIGTPGPSTFTNGSFSLFTLIFSFQYANPVQVANATTASATGDGYQINFTGTQLNTAQGVVTSFSLVYENVLNVTYTDVDMSFAKLKTAILNATSSDGQSVVDVFDGINWEYDLSGVVKHHEVSGTGGSDVFKLSSLSDDYFLDGGKDDVKLGGGDDFIYATNDYGYGAKGLAIVDGQSGIDRLYLSTFGNDLFEITVNIDLNATNNLNGGTVRFKNVENVVGSSHGERIYGTAVANDITGLEGDDRIWGRGGADILSGGVDDDIFIYKSIKDSTVKSHDLIKDFGIGTDRLDFSALHPNTQNDKLIFRSDGDFRGKDGEIRFELIDEAGDSNDHTIIEIDMNGNKKADLQIELSGLVDLTKADFIL